MKTLDENNIDFSKLFSNYQKSILMYAADAELESKIKLEELLKLKKSERHNFQIFSYPLAAAAIFGFGVVLILFFLIPSQLEMLLGQFL